MEAPEGVPAPKPPGVILGSAGASILAVGYALPLVYLLWSLRFGRKAGVNASRQNRKYAGGKAGAAFWLGETDDDNRAGLWHLIKVS